jgi:hypothetical protein
MLLVVTSSFSWAQQVTQPTSQEFQANPAQIFQQNPNGGPALGSLVRNLVVADKANLPLIIAQLATASPKQRSAIGSGLALAALAIVGKDPKYANEIQGAVNDTKDDVVKAAYAAVLGDPATAATGGGGGGGGGGGPTSPIIGSGAVSGATQTTGPNATQNTAFVTFTGTIGASVASPSNPVSP